MRKKPFHRDTVERIRGEVDDAFSPLGNGKNWGLDPRVYELALLAYNCRRSLCGSADCQDCALHLRGEDLVERSSRIEALHGPEYETHPDPADVCAGCDRAFYGACMEVCGA